MTNLRPPKYFPFAVLFLSGIFFLGSSLAASATKLDDISEPDDWVSNSLTSKEAKVHWHNAVTQMISTANLSVPPPKGVPGILSEKENPAVNNAMFHEGLVENLASRYLRCVKLDLWFKNDQIQLGTVEQLAEEDLTVFSQSRGVKGIMDIAEYIAVIEDAATYENIQPVEYEYRYFCDVLELVEED